MKPSPTAIHSGSLSDTAKRMPMAALLSRVTSGPRDPALLGKDWVREKKKRQLSAFLSSVLAHLQSTAVS